MSQPVILHVEDDPDDALFVAYAFSNALPECVIRRVKDGREAIDYLNRATELAKTGTQPMPDLMLLDLKLPDINGFEVLQWIRSHAQFKTLQVIVLSGSSIERDKKQARELGANAYFVKTPKYQDLVAFVAGLLKNPTPGLSLGAERKTTESPLTDSPAEPPTPS
jgi:DNA-binding response OmpR family regulator